MPPTEQAAMPGVRELFAIVFLHAVVEFAAWIAVLVVAFEQGGSAAAGLAVLIQLAPAALLAPVVGAAGDRFPRHRVIAVSFTVEAAAAAGIAVALFVDAPLGLVYVLAAVFTVSLVAAPSTVASLLVHHARTPAQLMSWNVVRSFVRAAGSLAGPLLTAVALAIASPAVAFVGLAATCAAAALLGALRLPRDDRMPAALSMASVVADGGRGVRYVAATPAPRRVVVVLGLTEMLIGALDLIFVAVAFDQLGREGSAAALFAVAFAAGALTAAAVASRLVAWRLGQLVTLGAVMFTLPMVALGGVGRLWVALALAAVIGAGHALIEIGGQTLLQRSCSETMTGRAFGALDSTALIAGAAGALITGRLIDGGDLAGTIVTLGAAGAVLLLLGSLWLRATERSLRPADPALVAALRTVPFLGSLPQPTLERLAQVSERRSVPPGTSLVLEGERGHEFFLIVSGAAVVTRGGETVGTLTAPASFGEAALLHDDVRLATVTTTGPVELLVIEQGDFLDAVNRTATSYHHAVAVAQQYRGASDPS